MNTTEALPVSEQLGLQVGEPAELWVLGTEDKETYVSRIEDVAGSRVVLAAPFRKLDVVHVPPGREMRIRVPRAAGLFSATARVESVSNAPVPVLDTRLVSAWRRQQRRMSVRLETRIRPHRIDLVLPDRTHPLNLLVASVSAGGLELVSQRQGRFEQTDLGPGADFTLLQRVWRDQELAIDLTLDNTRLQTTATITRLEHIEDLERSWYRLGAQFTALETAQQDAIFHFVFDEQRRLRRLVG